MNEEEVKRSFFQQNLQEEELKKQLKVIIDKMLDDKAKQRLANLKLVKPDVALQLEIYLAQLYQTGQLKRVSEAQLIEILKKISSKREIRIRRK